MCPSRALFFGEQLAFDFSPMMALPTALAGVLRTQLGTLGARAITGYCARLDARPTDQGAGGEEEWCGGERERLEDWLKLYGLGRGE